MELEQAKNLTELRRNGYRAMCPLRTRGAHALPDLLLDDEWRILFYLNDETDELMPLSAEFRVAPLVRYEGKGPPVPLVLALYKKSYVATIFSENWRTFSYRRLQ